MTLPTALAAPVEEGMMLAPAPRPPRPASRKQERTTVGQQRFMATLPRARTRSRLLTVLVGRSVNGLLGGGGSVNGSHQTLNNSKVVVDDLGQRRQTVGSARSVGDDVVLGLVSVQVYSTDEHGSIGRGGRDDDLLGTSLQVGGSLVNGGENTGGLDDVVGTVGSPGDGSRVTLLVDGDLLAVDDELSVLVGDLALESTVGRVVLAVGREEGKTGKITRFSFKVLATRPPSSSTHVM